MRASKTRVLVWVALAGALLLALAEVGVRAAGMIDFPLYDADATIGYIPKAKQHGSFLNRNDWAINEHHMAGDAFVPDPVSNVLLIGDSIVWGGNPYARNERLGPQLQGLLKGKVWSIAAGSWNLQNEVTYLNANADVVAGVDTIVLVLNSADLEPPSSWNCTMSHPRERPALALLYLAQKFLLKTPCEGTPPELKVREQDPVAMLADFLHWHANKRSLVFLYPDKALLADEALLKERLESMAPALAAAGVQEVVSIARDERWRGHPQFYRDAVHPTAEGNAALAGIMADALARRHVRGGLP